MEPQEWHLIQINSFPYADRRISALQAKQGNVRKTFVPAEGRDTVTLLALL